MKEVKGNFGKALSSMITRLKLPEFNKEYIIYQWNKECGNDWFVGTIKEGLKDKETLQAYRDLSIYTEDAVLERIENLELYLEDRASTAKEGDLNELHLQNKIRKLKASLDIIKKDKDYL